MSISSLVVDQLEAYGIPLQYASKVTGMFTGDIVVLGLRLAFIGLLAGLVRQSFAYCRHSLEHALFPTTHLSGLARVWVGSYLAHDPEVQRQLKHCRVLANADSAHEVMKKRSEGKSYLQGTWSDDGVNATVLPNDYQEVRITINGKWIWVRRHTVGYSGDPRCFDMHYRVKAWFWNVHHIKSFIVKAYNIHYDKSETDLHIYNHTPKVANWAGPVSRPCRPWSSVILPKGVKENLLKDVKSFVSEEEKSWYSSKGIPHRRGYLLHGPPGTGKTTLATALASTLRLDMYCINPAAVGMDNSKLEKRFRDCPPGSMILIEDIDCVMPINRATHTASDSTSDDGTADATANNTAAGKKDLGPSTVTLSGLLNAIDGVSSQEDSVLFASTNYPDKLDEALRRPGRFDVHIAFDHAVTEQAIDLYKHFYPLSRIQNDHPTEIQEKDNEPTTSHPFKDQSDLDRAAERFGEHMMGKNIKVSIATIQGFLLLYKKDPVMALDEAEEWAEGIRKDQFPDSNDLVEEATTTEEEGSAQDVVVAKEDSVKEEIVEQEEAKVEAQKEKDEVEKPELEKQMIVVGEAEKQEAVQEVTLA